MLFQYFTNGHFSFKSEKLLNALQAELKKKHE